MPASSTGCTTSPPAAAVASPSCPTWARRWAARSPACCGERATSIAQCCPRFRSIAASPGSFPWSALHFASPTSSMNNCSEEFFMSPSASTLARIQSEWHALEPAYLARTAQSRKLFDSARKHLPGGNTRSVLHALPYPLYMQSSQGAACTDVDGHRYIDFVGEFSAGLYGHSDPVLRDAVRAALDRGVVMAAPIAEEIALGELLCSRFPSLEQVRFCNSGTEANLFALATARAITGRSCILAFEHAYHGGVLTFSDRPSSMNMPFDVRLARFNDLESVERLVHAEGDAIAAIIVEPMLGAGGNIAPVPGFLAGLRQLADRCGAVLVFDEVKTSRLGPAGMQGREGVTPDMTTLGKYLGGGLPLAAFGGRADIMQHFDPARADGLKHAGTFNNNICSLSAAVAGLAHVYTPARAEVFTAWGDAVRERLNDQCRREGLPILATGVGSILSPHFTTRPIRSSDDIPATSRQMGQLLHRFLQLQGLLVCARGDIYLSLPMLDSDVDTLLAALSRFGYRYRHLIEEAAGVEEQAQVHASA
ncbi:MAG: aminotransferase class III-fold pyridoxal phosphate-dependent enzyme [Comamonadaceae bacterium]|nr:MAG: aminotransferase class III-fold pyridoxal phosphate-dependent enzyme [Comamonadaceae bacterium]